MSKRITMTRERMIALPYLILAARVALNEDRLPPRQAAETRKALEAFDAS